MVGAEVEIGAPVLAPSPPRERVGVWGQQYACPVTVLLLSLTLALS